jgi:hypothetical protein
LCEIIVTQVREGLEERILTAEFESIAIANGCVVKVVDIDRLSLLPWRLRHYG